MATPKELDGRNLGEKHQHLNQLVNEAIASDTYKINDFHIDDGDIINLIKIEVANKRRNVDYILKVLVCEDMLYVSRAIKRCQWLVTGDEYRHIINPAYLHSTLFPQMNTKSVIKFTKYIQLNLRDTARAEEFYEYESVPEKAVYWLPHCSSDFILQNFTKHLNHLKISHIRRLCDKNIMVLEAFIDVDNRLPTREIFEASLFILNSENINKYLDFVEKLVFYNCPSLNKTSTNLIMKLAADRIFKKFDSYCSFIHIPTFLKFLGRKNIKTFLLEYASKAKQDGSRQELDNLQIKCFFDAMQKDERFELVKQIFIDEIHTQKNSSLTNTEVQGMSYLYNRIKNKRGYRELQLYQYAPFDVAFTHIKELINQEPQSAHTNNMLSVLLPTVKRDHESMNLLIRYFGEKYVNAQYNLRYRFINNISSEIYFTKLDEKAWSVLEDVMMADIDNLNNNVQLFLEFIIIYKVLHSQSVPKIVEEKFKFNSLIAYKNRMGKEDEIIIFNYLYNYLKTKLHGCYEIKEEKQFCETITLMDLTLNLLNDWNKDFREYPLVINTIKTLINVKKQNLWKSNLSLLYNKNKSWKKWLFEESFDLNPCQSVFLNAVKHDSTIFERYKVETKELCLKEKENVTRFLRKIKIYWSQTLTKLWIDIFKNQLNNLNSQKASSRGVCILLPRKELFTMLNQYAPEHPKIDYGNINELNLNLQRCFATNMHIARPQPPPEIILLYAKGDYLKCSLPSLFSIYYNLSRVSSAKYITEILDAPISLQKHAIRFSFIKMSTIEIPPLYAKVWKTSKNTTIKSVLFTTVYNLLCKEKNHTEIEALWNLLEMFIDNLTFNENKNVYDTLLKVNNTPISVRAKFFMKSFTFMKSLLVSNVKYCEMYNSSINLFSYMREIIDALPPTYVVNVLLEFINEDFIKKSDYTVSDNISVISSYLLCAKDETTQMNKYGEIFSPIINYCAASYKENKSRDYCIKNLEILLNALCKDVPVFCIEKKMILPLALFSVIKNDLEQIFPKSENYLVLTKWTLVLKFIRSINGSQGDNWNDLCLAAASQFGEGCYEILYEHSITYFPRIYLVFTRALKDVLSLFNIDDSTAVKLKIYECLIHNEEFVIGYLATLRLHLKHFGDDANEELQNLRQIILQHPSLEVKMHYHHLLVK